MKKLIIMGITACMLAGTSAESIASRRVVKRVHKTKHGMSHKAKGTIVGAGSGAIIGGVANGGKGAVVGGVIGAGTGYLIGRHVDKKHPSRKTKVIDKTVIRHH